MGDKINRALGLKPATKTRQATHGKALRSGLACVHCGTKGHVREVTLSGQVNRRCDFCGKQQPVSDAQ